MFRVECVDYHGNNRKLLSQHSGIYLFGVTFFYPYLFTSGYYTGMIYKLNAFSINGTVVSSLNITIGNAHTWGLVSYDSSRQISGMHKTFYR